MPKRIQKKNSKSDYTKYLLSSHWKKVKLTMYARYSVCQVCGSIKQLNIHHLDYSILNKELEGNNADKLVVLCECCHRRAHRTNALKVGTRAQLIKSLKTRFLSKKKTNNEKLTSKKRKPGENRTPVVFSWLE